MNIFLSFLFMLFCGSLFGQREDRINFNKEANSYYAVGNKVTIKKSNPISIVCSEKTVIFNNLSMNVVGIVVGESETVYFCQNSWKVTVANKDKVLIECQNVKFIF